MTLDTIFPESEWKSLLSDMDDDFSIFATLYSTGKPRYSETIPTAAVSFNRAGNCIDFQANPTFWSKLSRDEKAFVLSHEALHVFLNHGKRITDVHPREAMMANQALDVVINHTLVDRFGHDRSRIDKSNQYCWIDTVFKGVAAVRPAQNYEYYMALLREKRKKQKEEQDKDGKGGGSGGGGSGQTGKDEKGEGGGGKPINDHSGLKSFGKGDEEEGKGDAQRDRQLGELLKRTLGKAGLEELAGKLAGTEAGEIRRIMEKVFTPPKRKWETVIRNWSLQFRDEKPIDQFILTNRRYAMMPCNEVYLPTEGEIEANDKRRIEVWFYLDTSGSCTHLAQRLFTAAMSLPKDRFAVRLFCFDTRVYDVDPVKRELFGFGGTSFACIETHIQQQLLYGEKRYPKAVFVLTDGYGDEVKPALPSRWHWFLTYDCRHYIPSESNVYKLEDYE